MSNTYAGNGPKPREVYDPEFPDEFGPREGLPSDFVGIMKCCPECGGKLDNTDKRAKGCPSCKIVFYALAKKEPR